MLSVSLSARTFHAQSPPDPFGAVVDGDDFAVSLAHAATATSDATRATLMPTRTSRARIGGRNRGASVGGRVVGRRRVGVGVVRGAGQVDHRRVVAPRRGRAVVALGVEEPESLAPLD